MSSFLTNQQIARLLREVAAVYEVKGENHFRVSAYQRAADAIEHSSSEVKDLYDEQKLDEIPGVGQNIAGYLDELFRSGKVKHFEGVKKELPAGFFAILGIPSIGPKTAHKLTQSLKIESLEDLKKLCSAHEVSKLPGLGAKTEEEILRGIEEFEQRSSRLLLPSASRIAQDLIAALKAKLGEIEIAPLGSLRRQVSTVGDLDLAAASQNPSAVIEAFVNLAQVERILDRGEHKASITLKNGRRIDLMVSTPQKYGSLLQHFTGSKLHNIHLRKIALEKGLSLSEYGIRKIDKEGFEFAEDMLWEFETEQEFYKALGLQYIPPELREDQGEVEAALRSAQGKPDALPKLVEASDIRGEFHLHSNFPIEPSHDPGVNSIEEVVEKAASLGYEYLAISDHSPAVTTHSTEEIAKLVGDRNRYIDQLIEVENSKFKMQPFGRLKVASSKVERQNAKSQSKIKNSPIAILKALEVDILADGRLALPNELLQTLDLVLVGVHSSLGQDKETMTKRILGALQNPYVHILAHPTGRLLLEREGYEADWEKILKLCAEWHKALEINGYPNRLDLPDFLIRESKKYGVKFVINSDSHEISQMENLKYGVSQARRGWCSKEDILNTLPLNKLLAWFGKKGYN